MRDGGPVVEAQQDTAVRRHRPTGLCASASDHRSQRVNKVHAIRHPTGDASRRGRSISRYAPSAEVQLGANVAWSHFCARFSARCGGPRRADATRSATRQALRMSTATLNKLQAGLAFGNAPAGPERTASDRCVRPNRPAGRPPHVVAGATNCHALAGRAAPRSTADLRCFAGLL